MLDEPGRPLRDGRGDPLPRPREEAHRGAQAVDCGPSDALREQLPDALHCDTQHVQDEPEDRAEREVGRNLNPGLRQLSEEPVPEARQEVVPDPVEELAESLLQGPQDVAQEGHGVAQDQVEHVARLGEDPGHQLNRDPQHVEQEAEDRHRRARQVAVVEHLLDHPHRRCDT